MKSAKLNPMSTALDTTISLAFPRTLIPDVVELSGDMISRMHDLLERNANEELSVNEQEDLQTLVQMAQFSQVIALSLQAGKVVP